VHSSCVCATVRPCDSEIPPRESRELTVDINLAPGPGKVEFAIESNDPSGPRRFAMLWNGVGAKPKLSPAEIRVTVDGTSDSDSTVCLTAPYGMNSEIEIETITLRDDYPSLELILGKERMDYVFSPYDPNGGQLRVLPLDVLVRGGAGRIQTTCDIALRYGGERHLLKLPIDITFRPTLRAEPEKLIFSALSSDQMVGLKRQVRLTHPHGRLISVTQLPEWITADVLDREATHTLVNLTVRSCPPDALTRDQVMFECEGHQPFVVGVMAIAE